MDQQQQNADSWQMPLWNEDTIDPSWFFDLLADPVQDLATQAPINASSSLRMEDMNFDSTFQDFTFDDLSPSLMSSLPSPGYNLDASPRLPTERFEYPLQQRQHTLPRRRSKYMMRKSTGKSSPIVIHSGSPQNDQGQSLAMQRWRNSPPEDEAASLSAIYKAFDNQPMGESPRNSRPPSRDAFPKHRGPSSSTSVDSAVSESSLRSWNSSHSAASQTKHRNQAPKTRVKGSGKGRKGNMNDPDRTFKCTFCCDTFKHKYDWTRHEKSLHLHTEEWMCTPHGASVVLPLTGRVHCAYCSALDPTSEHLEQHNPSCSDGQSTRRVFRRKDHLVQHLRLVHGLEVLPLIDDWKVDSIPVTCRCGFCQSTLNSWDARADHLATHFREGKTMADWKGEHGFEPAVAARVTNAYPPYLLAAQAETLVPFSATNPASLDHTHQLLSQIHLENPLSAPLEEQVAQDDSLEPLWDPQTMRTQFQKDFSAVLTKHLSRFARQQMLMGVILTDKMFQRESRRLLYHDGDDEWNQTVADDPSWMLEFRKRSGLDKGPSI